MERLQQQEQLQEFQAEQWEQAQAQPSMGMAYTSVPCEIDMDDVPVPLTRERLLGLQHELLEAFSAEAFQARLRRCERKYPRSSAAFRREHQQLAMDVQAGIIPKYGFEGSLEGVGDMLLAIKPFTDDPEVSRNIQTINRLVAKSSPPAALRELRSGTVVPQDDAWHQHQQENWQQYQQQQEFLWSQQLSEEELEQQQRPADKLTFRGAPVEIDMEDVTVPLERERALTLQKDITVPLKRERALTLQKELHDMFSARGFQAQLRECELRHAGQPAELHREHQELVMGVQASVLPKYGFEPTLEGVLDMLAAVRELAADDPEVSANVDAINGLIALKARARPAPPPAGQEPATSAGQGPSGAEAAAVAQEGYWVVTGGKKTGGILVRLGEEITSQALPEVLAFGAVVKELHLSRGRLSFEKVSGDGPSRGWVSLRAGCVSLLEPYEGTVPAQAAQA